MSSMLWSVTSPRVCDCAACIVFPPPARKAQPGKHGPPVAWRARWYGLQRDNYYRNAKGPLLHRAVWVAHHGTIPDGHHIHHMDHDRSNNHIDNLECLTPVEHERKHRSPHRGIRSWSREQRSQASKVMWANLPAHSVTCRECGNVFQSTGMRAAFCARKCWRRNYERERKNSSSV